MRGSSLSDFRAAFEAVQIMLRLLLLCLFVLVVSVFLFVMLAFFPESIRALETTELTLILVVCILILVIPY